ncbi:LamG domain-containing protein [Amycolatopsis sp. NPDC003865]
MPDRVADENGALAAARTGHKPVLVTSKLTETDEVWAQPDGTFTWRQFLQPVRVKRGTGWVDADPSLVVRPDGSIAPKAAAVDLALSGGGTGSPLARVGRDGAEVGLRWTGALPAPSVDGPTATYAEVLPGVDLKVTANVTGFSEVLVVKDRAAAERVTKVDFGSYTRNTKVDKGTGDALRVTDGSGRVVFHGNATRMWDSSGSATPSERLTGIGEGVRSAVMGTEVTADRVSIVPDQGFLADQDTKYPVYLDPEYTCSGALWCGKQHHVVVQSGHPDAPNFDATGGDLGDLKAGYETSDSAGVSRTYFQMNTAPIIGKKIHWANVNTTLLYSWWGAGSATSTQLYLANWVDGGTTWRNQPGWGEFLGSSNAVNQSKAPNVSAVFGATNAAVYAAANGWGTTTFVLKGEQEGNTTSWRRFGLNPYLEVNFDSYPNNPTGHSMQNGAVPCVKGANRPWIATATPQLQAQVSDPDGGSLSVLVATSQGPYGQDVANTYHDNGAGRFSVASGGTAQFTVPSGWIGSDGIAKWAMRVSDGELDSPRWDWDCEFVVDSKAPLAPTLTRSGTPPSLQGDPANFTLSVPMATSGLFDIDRFVYTTDGSEPSTQGSPSVPATQAGDGTATAALSTTAVNGNQNLVRVKAVNKAGTPGANAVCGAGLITSGTACVYTVAPLTPEKGLKGAWGIDDTWGTTSADNVATLNPGTTGHPLSLNGDSRWALGYSKGNGWTQPESPDAKDGTKGGMGFGSNTGFLSTSGPVLDTTGSFSVSAWVNMTDTSSWHGVVSQDGGTSSGMFLEYSQEVNRWTFNLPGCDCGDPYNPRVVSQQPPRLNVWTHLAGTYDAKTGVATLYVDGVQQNSLVRSAWAATGPLTVGALKWNGTRASFFPGRIDDVQVWQRVLSAGNVHDLATASVSRAGLGLAEGAAGLLATGATGDQASGNYVPAPVPSLQGYWKFDEGAGTAAADASNNGGGYANNPLTLNGSATWTPGKSGAAAYFPGGVGNDATSAGPGVDTSNSFTVSAWAKLDDLTGYYSVLGQSGTNVPAFMMRYSPDVKAWIFGMNPSDDTAALAGTQWAYLDNSVTQAGQWTLLTGVYDNDTKQIRMYVNGKPAGQRKFTGTPWNAAGRVTVGRYEYGTSAAYFKGAIDQVQMWQQALTPSQIAGLAGLSYSDSVWNINGANAGTPHGTVSEVAGNGAARAQFAGNQGNDVALAQPDSFRTDQSYTFEAWVKSDTDDDVTRAVFGGSGAQFTPFTLGYRKDSMPQGKWAFGVSCSQTSGCFDLAVSDAPAAHRVWVHLAATYDLSTNTACLYVNGVKQSTCVTPRSAYQGDGVLVGRVQWNGVAADPWLGGIAGVRLYSGVRTAVQIQSDRTADDPGQLFGAVH